VSVTTGRAEPIRTSRLIIVIVTACTLTIAGLFAAVLRGTWQASTADAGVAKAERSGVVYLHTMVGLIGQLVETQSAAVRGAPVDAAAVRKSLAAVSTADRSVGAALGVQQRFADLRDRVEAALSRTDQGPAAYQTYTDLVALAVDLADQVGDTSHLIHDQDLDSYYVMDSALILLPNAMVLAGRAADLVTLAGGSELGGDDAIRAAVARYDVATAAEQVTAGLNKAVEVTSRAALGSDIALQLDAFQAAVDGFAPPTMLAQLAGSVNAADLAAGAHRVFETALPLAHKLLSELDALLAARQAAIAAHQMSTKEQAGAAAAVGLVLMLVVVAWWRRRRRSMRAMSGPVDPFGSPAEPHGSVDSDEVATAAAATTFWPQESRYVR
jgi:hypothetical protein